jgi:hypothetical protein
MIWLLLLLMLLLDSGDELSTHQREFPIDQVGAGRLEHKLQRDNSLHRHLGYPGKPARS